MLACLLQNLAICCYDPGHQMRLPHFSQLFLAHLPPEQICKAALWFAFAATDGTIRLLIACCRC